MEGRYWASLIAAILTLALAFGAAPIASLLGVLPQSYIFALAGLAILSSFQDALERAFEGRSPRLPGIGVDPAFDAMRDDPRFASLVDRVGILVPATF